MILNKFIDKDNERKYNNIIRKLEEKYNFDYNFIFYLEYDQIKNLYEALNEYKTKTLNESKFNSCFQDSEYFNNMLLKEALRIVLSEFSLLSNRKRKKKKKVN